MSGRRCIMAALLMVGLLPAAAGAVDPQASAWVAEGKRLKRQGRTDEAIQTLRKAVLKDDTCIEGHYALGWLFFGKRDHFGTKWHFDAVIRLQPHSQMAREAQRALIKLDRLAADKPVVRSVTPSPRPGAVAQAPRGTAFSPPIHRGPRSPAPPPQMAPPPSSGKVDLSPPAWARQRSAPPMPTPPRPEDLLTDRSIAYRPASGQSGSSEWDRGWAQVVFRGGVKLLIFLVFGLVAVLLGLAKRFSSR